MNISKIIYKSKRKAILIIVISVLLIIAGLLIVHYTDKNVIGWSIFILSVLFCILGISNLFDKKPYILLTENGITELSSVKEEIEWNAILQADDFFYRGQYFIRLLMNRNYKPTLIQPTWFYRFDRLYEKEGVKAIFIRMSLYEVNALKLTQFIRLMMKADTERRKELLNMKLSDQ